jgi:glycerol uptake facilitator-like aquaporin
MNPSNSRAFPPAILIAEAVGTALLLATVIGSGIMAERLAHGNEALALLANTLATVFALFVLIRIFAPLSGAHFNPVVSAIQCLRGQLPATRLPLFLASQFAGAVLGALLAHGMFDLPLIECSTKARIGPGLWLAETVATAGLLLVVLRSTARTAPANVAAYIGAAYWFTASTSFANPAATVGRMFTNTFAGIAPASVAPFLLAQLLGALLGWATFLLLGQPEATD